MTAQDQVERYVNNWMDITFELYWLNSPNEFTPLTLLSDWLSEIWRVWAEPNGVGPKADCFRRATTVQVWNPNRPDCGQIKTDAGLSYYDGHIELNLKYADPTCLSHEFGHLVAWLMLIYPDWCDRLGSIMWGFYCGIRGQDFTTRTPAAERWAEDFLIFFGANAARGRLRPEDDHFVLGTRSAFDVPGLRAFIAHFATVLSYWRRVNDTKNHRYDANTGCWYWERPYAMFWTTYEASIDGQLFRWENGGWQPKPW